MKANSEKNSLVKNDSVPLKSSSIPRLSALSILVSIRLSSMLFRGQIWIFGNICTATLYSQEEVP